MGAPVSAPRRFSSPFHPRKWRNFCGDLHNGWIIRISLKGKAASTEAITWGYMSAFPTCWGILQLSRGERLTLYTSKSDVRLCLCWWVERSQSPTNDFPNVRTITWLLCSFDVVLRFVLRGNSSWCIVLHTKLRSNSMFVEENTLLFQWRSLKDE